MAQGLTCPVLEPPLPIEPGGLPILSKPKERGSKLVAASERVVSDKALARAELEELRRTGRLFEGKKVSREVRDALLGVLGKVTTFEPAVREDLEKLLVSFPTRPATGGTVRIRRGDEPFGIDDDALRFGKPGSIDGDTGITPFTRGWVQTKIGVLRERHGSQVPKSIALTEEERTAAQASSPGAALDRAAKALKKEIPSFEEVAKSKPFYDPNAPDWVGKCHAWVYAGLNQWVNEHVDVAGPPGERGLWIAGEWLSRADLGSWVTGMADRISLNDTDLLWCSHPTPEQLIKAALQFCTTKKGAGLGGDVWNDEQKKDFQKWNQPFVSASLTSSDLTGVPEVKVLAVAAADGVSGAERVQLVSLNARYAKEPDFGENSWEEAPNLVDSRWNFYVVQDAAGRPLKSYLAYDDKLKEVSDLPERTSADMPDYLFKSALSVFDDARKGRPNEIVDRDNLGKHFRFMLENVLSTGVPGELRERFETSVANPRTAPPAPLSREEVRELAKAFPRIANAYSPEQWAKTFAPLGLSAHRFGAAWA